MTNRAYFWAILALLAIALFGCASTGSNKIKYSESKDTGLFETLDKQE